ncbi:sigma-70 family RNA polymerase sigma factor [Silvibacterium dinghuense]|uniref:RNA polymerase sigma factor n=1 Tax=Silvibacterium dinghuense TaxID=1560006 RepID=A0A4Q1SHF8_9BACT|nr:sigma-70 family RNA polymerase sigma factor [Silvibacterium dinghuense]RXS96610.1 sigma-70 family RNA polymerase sigma factor [Silvibacterium dinghuense]GGG92213.1 RNA polymerase sigma factor [Silvibacterium dinghuense]
MTASGPIGAAPGLSTEAALITAVLAGERDKFHLLILPYEAQLYRTAFALVKNTQEAEDVVQDAVLKAYRRLASFRGDAKFSTWLIAITLNEARSRLRRENRVPTDSLDERREDQGDFTPAALTDWREVPQAALERQEIRSLIECALAELPESYREIIILRDVEELSVNETAELLGISVALVKVRLHRARMMLQKILAPQLSRTANNVLQSGKRSWLGRFSWL